MQQMQAARNQNVGMQNSLVVPGTVWITSSIAGVSGSAIPTPQEPLPSGGMKVEDLIGWRIWRVKNDHLWSYNMDYAWMPGGVSEGEPGDHDSAGVWAFKDKRRAFQKAIESGRGFVWGSVRLWGHVVEHKDGYRASKARIVSIDGASRDVSPEAMTNLCRLYRVPEIETPAMVVHAVSHLVKKPTPPPFGELPPLAIESKGDTPWPVIWIVGGVLLACSLMPMLRP